MIILGSGEVESRIWGPRRYSFCSAVFATFHSLGRYPYPSPFEAGSSCRPLTSVTILPTLILIRARGCTSLTSFGIISVAASCFFQIPPFWGRNDRKQLKADVVRMYDRIDQYKANYFTRYWDLGAHGSAVDLSGHCLVRLGINVTSPRNNQPPE
jgi:hypothetical protein